MKTLLATLLFLQISFAINAIAAPVNSQDTQVNNEYAASFVSATVNQQQIIRAQNLYGQTTSAYQRYLKDMSQYENYLEAVRSTAPQTREKLSGLNNSQINQSLAPVVRQAKQYLDKAAASYAQYNEANSRLSTEIGNMSSQINQVASSVAGGGGGRLGEVLKHTDMPSILNNMTNMVSNGADPTATGVNFNVVSANGKAQVQILNNGFGPQ